MYTFEKVSTQNYAELNRIRNSVREFLHDSRKFTMQETLDWISKNPNHYLYIHHASQIIGYKRVSEAETLLEKSIFVGLDLDPKWQGKGHGGKAWIQILDTLRNHYRHVELKVLSGNLKAILLYLKIGFKEIEEKRSDNDIHLYLRLDKL